MVAGAWQVDGELYIFIELFLWFYKRQRNSFSVTIVITAVSFSDMLDLLLAIKLDRVVLRNGCAIFQ